MASTSGAIVVLVAMVIDIVIERLCVYDYVRDYLCYLYRYR